MLFEKNKEMENVQNYEVLKQIEYKSKYGFLDELRNCVRTDEEFAKFKGYID